MKNENCLGIALALGGGGLKGFAHIGVLKVLEENNIPIDAIAGSSIGALVGGLYAEGLRAKDIEDAVLHENWRKLFLDPSLSEGLIKGKKIEKYIRSLIGGKRFSDTHIPLAITATDLETAELLVLKDGDVASAIRASIAIPIIFKPLKKNGRFLVDGGFSLPVPAYLAQAKSPRSVLVSVNLHEDYALVEKKNSIGFTTIANNAIDILCRALAREDVKSSDVVIVPKVGLVSWDKAMSQRGAKEVILKGEEAAREMIPKLKILLENKRKI